MFLETIRSEGLSHLSYILGDGNEAAVIDPRRDAKIYQEIAYRQGARITHIFETHRNEDYVTGSLELARLTDAKIHHGQAMQFEFGQPVADGDSFHIGHIRLDVLETPGHTLEHISLSLTDTASGEGPVAVFTGDTLFIGDVGRTDFYPDRAEEVAGMLYDSLHDKLLPLGDHVILYPAHGVGSVCGSGMANREFSTLGYERRNNPRLKLNRESFVCYKIAEHHYQPPYFRRMEAYNISGPPVVTMSPCPVPYGADRFATAIDDGLQVLDVRSPESYAGTHIPGSLAIPLKMLPTFAGWHLNYEDNIGLVTTGYDDIGVAVTYLSRLGYDRVCCFLDSGMHAWEISGRPFDNVPVVYAQNLNKRIQGQEAFTLLDVRSADEFRAGHLPGAEHQYVGKLSNFLMDLPRGQRITTFCGSGQRAVIAASVLQNAGFSAVEVCLGSMQACERLGCMQVKGD